MASVFPMRCLCAVCEVETARVCRPAQFLDGPTTACPQARTATVAAMSEHTTPPRCRDRSGCQSGPLVRQEDRGRRGPGPGPVLDGGGCRSRSPRAGQRHDPGRWGLPRSAGTSRPAGPTGWAGRSASAARAAARSARPADPARSADPADQQAPLDQQTQPDPQVQPTPPSRPTLSRPRAHRVREMSSFMISLVPP